MQSFNLWSESNIEVKKNLKPNFELRGWNSLSQADKILIWKYLDNYFFDQKIVSDYDMMGHVRDQYYNFYGEYNERTQKQERIVNSISVLNHLYKVKSYAKKYLDDPNLNSACADFFKIFVEEDKDVVIELLSIYCKILIFETQNLSVFRVNKESNEDYTKRCEKEKWKNFDKFSDDLNEIFLDFSLNLVLTRLCFIPRQDSKIMEEVYSPVLKCLSHEKWKKVNDILVDSFENYRKGSSEGYSNCVTNTVSAVQAFLQILVNGEVGKGDFSELIPQARKKRLIPDDYFTEKVFSNIQSVLMRERQETGIAHPKLEYATENNSRLVLNLSMVFFQHCLQA